MSQDNWISFWNSEHSIYVNARHLDQHYREVADRILQLGPAPGAQVLDFGCGEATHADRVAASVGQLWLCEAAARVRDHLRTRFGGQPNIKVIGPDELQAIPAGTLDLVVANSVAQYLTRDELDALLRTWRRLLTPDGRLVLADVVPPGVSPVSDALALLRYAWRNDFLGAAIAGLVRTVLSPYRRIRASLGITTYTEREITERIDAAGFKAARLPFNFEHQPARLSFVATPR
ncbi:class I SAM-dependent methyltransferase [Bradyrhizobium sp. LHD-71]|uniref:class I SAM-dependent methyltransferase n=1 Tax=Bradyrhizobium sp. LHD-71 TaxID=3072141 RepID=UPI00280FD0A2|nr:class I SAM-dependent methyltransferase [Bradyrhizobium sp. LHD-71]MDQ8726950.1 class I SAM-dependent methyltransferase [Bradyrhizobium sp. LHD-71]